mmetsp:Transcript_79031/g.228482  ORF Transcript_79031/g.228482 Transcript_79031/m.228482 type:complete len:270 (+) Transcript_79031:739-1548(+)
MLVYTEGADPVASVERVVFLQRIPQPLRAFIGQLLRDLPVFVKVQSFRHNGCHEVQEEPGPCVGDHPSGHRLRAPGDELRVRDAPIRCHGQRHDGSSHDVIRGVYNWIVVRHGAAGLAEAIVKVKQRCDVDTALRELLHLVPPSVAPPLQHSGTTGAPLQPSQLQAGAHWPEVPGHDHDTHEFKQALTCGDQATRAVPSEYGRPLSAHTRVLEHQSHGADRLHHGYREHGPTDERPKSDKQVDRPCELGLDVAVLTISLPRFDGYGNHS